MNIDQMANHVCRKVRQTDSAAISTCKEFIRDRYTMICEESLWRDLIYMFGGTLAVTGEADHLNSTTFNSLGYYLMPTFVDRVLAIRTPTNSMSPEGTEQLFQMNPDVFEQVGQPVKYDIMSPRIWMFPSATQIASTSTDLTTDPGVEVTADIIGDLGRRKININVNDIAPADDGGDSPLIIERLNKAASSGTVTVFYLDPSPVIIATMSAEETALSGYITVRVLPKPTVDTAIKILVKKKPLSLDNDSDVPELRGVDLSLMAFAQGDMLQRARQYAKADAVYAQAMALLESLKNQNVWQESCSRRVIPHDGPSGESDYFDKANFL